MKAAKGRRSWRRGMKRKTLKTQENTKDRRHEKVRECAGRTPFCVFSFRRAYTLRQRSDMTQRLHAEAAPHKSAGHCKWAAHRLEILSICYLHNPAKSGREKAPDGRVASHSDGCVQGLGEDIPQQATRGNGRVRFLAFCKCV